MSTKPVQTHRRQHRDRQIKQVIHDPYAEKHKPEGSAFCPDCGAVFHRGRWTWAERPESAHAHLCPACHRIRDGFPAGYLTVRGEYAMQHRSEVEALIRHQESLAKAEHPLQRVLEFKAEPDALRITTTDLHLAQRLGKALQAAHKGDLQIQHGEDDYIVRVDWMRA